MNDWLIKESQFSGQNITACGNRFLCGNGYLGIRGTLEEYGREQLPAINLSGIYDRVGEGWREPLNAPNPLYTRIKVDGEYFCLPETTPISHEQQVDYRHGLVGRRTVFQAKRGKVTVEAERFAHMGREHLIGMQYTVTTDFHADVEVQTGIDGDVWDINGPHYDTVSKRAEGSLLLERAVTHEKQDEVAVAECYRADASHELRQKEEDKKILHRICFVTDVNKPVVIEKVMAVYTTNDGKDPLELAKTEVEKAETIGYEALKKEHMLAWEELWKYAEVEIEGDVEAMRALNYSLYHLLCIAPYHAKSQSIPARGLSGQTYKGAVFWDTEMFMLDFFLHTNPAVAKTLLKYRIDTLPGAQKKAAHYGYEGAFYAWESQEGGFDACSDYNVTDVFTGRPMRTYFKDKQIHISAAIVYGIVRYVEMTGNTSLLYEGGAKTIVECAKFYDSLLVKKVHSDVYELRDVIGPDEYHERVNNNGYTNRMAKFVFGQAAELLSRCGKEKDLAEALSEYRDEQLKERFSEDEKHLYIPMPEADGVIEQFDGYRNLEDTTVDAVRSRLLNEKEYWGGAYGVAADTQIIKQADVVTWMVMFPEDFPEEIKWKNWSYYEPRTEHGSSLSACMYSILACVCGRQEEAYPFFLKSAQADLRGGGKEWAGSIYIGGTHPAAAGGAYMTAVKGFGGLKIRNGKLSAEPKLPPNWKKLRFRLYYRGELYEITETPQNAEIRRIDG